MSALLVETGLELVPGFSIADLLSQLYDAAYEHYWNEFTVILNSSQTHWARSTSR